MHCKLLRDTPPLQNYLTHHFFRDYFILFLTIAQMAHFSFPYYSTIPNSEFRIPKSMDMYLKQLGI